MNANDLESDLDACCKHSTHIKAMITMRTQKFNQSNCALDRTGDAGHKDCGAIFAPKAHRFPRSADGDARRSGHRGR